MTKPHHMCNISCMDYHLYSYRHYTKKTCWYVSLIAPVCVLLCDRQVSHPGCIPPSFPVISVLTKKRFFSEQMNTFVEINTHAISRQLLTALHDINKQEITQFCIALTEVVCVCWKLLTIRFSSQNYFIKTVMNQWGKACGVAVPVSFPCIKPYI